MAETSNTSAAAKPAARTTRKPATKATGTTRKSTSARGTGTTRKSTSARGTGTTAAARKTTQSARATATSARRTTRQATTTARRGGRATANVTATRVEQVQHLAERTVLVQAGAALLVRDNLVATVTGFASRYRTTAGLERELKRFEKRGSTARSDLERQARRARTQVERELRQRRTQAAQTVQQNRKAVERELSNLQRDPSKYVAHRVERLVTEAAALLS